MPDAGPVEMTTLTTAELELIQRIATRDGVTVEQAASRLFSDGLARRVKRKTGHTPAKVYTIRRNGR